MIDPKAFLEATKKLEAAALEELKLFIGHIKPSEYVPVQDRPIDPQALILKPGLAEDVGQTVPERPQPKNFGSRRAWRITLDDLLEQIALALGHPHTEEEVANKTILEFYDSDYCITITDRRGLDPRLTFTDRARDMTLLKTAGDSGQVRFAHRPELADVIDLSMFEEYTV